MYLIIYADKDSYDRPIDITLQDQFSSPEQASDELKNILCSWLKFKEPDDVKLWGECDYNTELYCEHMKKRFLERINKTIENQLKFVQYNDYESYQINYDSDKNLTMITTGCPRDNEYMGETYQVIYV